LENNEFQQPNGTQLETPLTLGEWLITLIVLMIPCLNIVMLFVWGFGSGNVSRKNYCRAALILMVIGAVIGFIFSASIAALFATALSGAY